MPTENAYSLQDLADLADVTPRTVRYYITQGLLPSPGQVGPGARYTDGHLARLRLIRRLQREHLPLAEIRARLAGLDDDAIAALAEAEAGPLTEGSALDYIRTVLEGPQGEPSGPTMAGSLPLARKAFFAIPVQRSAPVAGRLSTGVDAPAPAASGPPAGSAHPLPTPDRSQWERVSLAPDVELHIRRPLSRIQNKQVDRLIAIARELLEEDPS